MEEVIVLSCDVAPVASKDSCPPPGSMSRVEASIACPLCQKDGNTVEGIVGHARSYEETWTGLASGSYASGATETIQNPVHDRLSFRNCR